MQTTLPPRSSNASRNSAAALDHHRFDPIIRRIASKLATRLPATVRKEDLVGSGWVGVLEAMSRNQTDHSSEQLEAYVTIRARGAMLDHLRTLDVASRGVRSRARRLRAAEQRLAATNGRAPTAEETAAELGIGLDQLHRLEHSIDEVRVEHFEDSGSHEEIPDAAPTPEAIVARRLRLGTLASAIARLPERLQNVLSLYYEHDCTLAEIGATLGVTESRVCQLHAEAVKRLRADLPQC